MRTKTRQQDQLGFEALLRDAERTNHDRRVAAATGHLPATMADALPFFRTLIEAHHDAMLRAAVDEVMRCREEAHTLAVKLNGGAPGILAGDDSSGHVLARETAAAAGAVPLWGQTGDFIVTAAGVRVRVEMDGMFGLGTAFGFWPGFSARAVELDRPFISETGYRSFIGLHAEPVPRLTPDAFAGRVIAGHVARGMKGKLVSIADRYRQQGC